MSLASAIEFKHVSKQFPGQVKPAIKDVTFCIEDGEFISILGASGSGKTTLLKMINCLVEPDEGEIYFYGQPISKMDPITLRRQIGYVIQQIGLFRHMTVSKNIAVVPELLGWEKSDIQRRVDELLELVHLPASEFRSRYPSELSGGQQQRIGLARALAANPKVMLLDEPFGALDAITRSDLQQQLLELHQGAESRTFILITHDMDEALRLGDRILIMDQGEVVQFGRPEEIIAQPNTYFVASLVQTMQRHYEDWRKLHD